MSTEKPPQLKKFAAQEIEFMQADIDAASDLLADIDTCDYATQQAIIGAQKALLRLSTRLQTNMRDMLRRSENTEPTELQRQRQTEQHIADLLEWRRRRADPLLDLVEQENAQRYQ